jgi:dCTP deaminase
MMLSDADIQHFRNTGHLGIEPWNNERLQPVSYDLTLGCYVKYQERVYVLSADGEACVDGFTWVKEKFEEGPDGRLFYILKPKKFALFSTVETVTLDSSVAGEVAGKSSWARNGLGIETAGLVDAGFSGELTLELTNHSEFPITLVAGKPIAQIKFYELRTPSRRPYGSEGLGSHYQHQTGPTNAR